MGFTVDPIFISQARSDVRALEELLGAIWPEAYRVSLGILTDRGLAEDAAQEACATVALGLTALRTDEAFYAWMYRIIVRHATAASKRVRRTERIDAVVHGRFATPDDERLDIANALAALPLAQRTAIVLHYYAGFTSGEIAAATGKPAPTVRFHLMLARRTLRAALAVIDSNAPAPLEAYPHAR